MSDAFDKLISGYSKFREKYAEGDDSIMKRLANHGQSPSTMIIACCDSRVDPALLMQCEPGDLFVVRNIANAVPSYLNDGAHHGTSAALEFGICYLNVSDLILLGHSQCGGIQAKISGVNPEQDEFITRWVSEINLTSTLQDVDKCAQNALLSSYENCLTYPWIKSRIEQKKLALHPWFFDIGSGEIQAYSFEEQQFNRVVDV